MNKQEIHITDGDGCSDCAGFWNNDPIDIDVLKKMGFEESDYCLEYPQPNPHIEIKGGTNDATGEGFVFLRVDRLVLPYRIWKTVGSVKMLIYVLTGDK